MGCWIFLKTSFSNGIFMLWAFSKRTMLQPLWKMYLSFKCYWTFFFNIKRISSIVIAEKSTIDWQFSVNFLVKPLFKSKETKCYRQLTKQRSSSFDCKLPVIIRTPGETLHENKYENTTRNNTKDDLGWLKARLLRFLSPPPFIVFLVFANPGDSVQSVL